MSTPQWGGHNKQKNYYIKDVQIITFRSDIFSLGFVFFFFCFFFFASNLLLLFQNEKKILLEYLNCNYLRSGWATISDGLTTIYFGYWQQGIKVFSVEAVDLKYKFSKYLLF